MPSSRVRSLDSEGTKKIKSNSFWNNQTERARTASVESPGETMAFRVFLVNYTVGDIQSDFSWSEKAMLVLVHGLGSMVFV